MVVHLDFYRDSNRRVDLDNLVKLVFDSLNAFVWADDSQIVRLVTEKYLDRENPRTEIAVWLSGDVEAVLR